MFQVTRSLLFFFREAVFMMELPTFKLKIERFLLERGLRFRNLDFCGHDLM
jgi:hypothetical protein